MFQSFQKYSSSILLILMSVVLVSLVADEMHDLQHFSKHVTASACMTMVSEDFDIEDDEEDDTAKPILVGETPTITCSASACTTKLSSHKRPLALQHGQVRRYAPRSGLCNNNNRTILSITYSGVDSFHATFFFAIHII